MRTLLMWAYVFLLVGTGVLFYQGYHTNEPTYYAWSVMVLLASQLVLYCLGFVYGYNNHFVSSRTVYEHRREY